MNVTIQPSAINGKIPAPCSKSVAQRVFAASLLSRGETLVTGYTESNDSTAALEIIQNLGARIKSGNNPVIKGNPPAAKTAALRLDCGESGLSSRLFAPLSLLYSENVTINGRGSLLKRPFSGLMRSPFEQMGIKYSDNNGFLPVNLQGQLSAKEITADGSGGSQFLSGILMALPLLPGDSVVRLRNPKSKPYIDLTVNVASKFGVAIENENYGVFRIRGRQHYACGSFNIEGDWSGASCLLVAGAVAGEIEVTNLDYQSHQADKRIVEILAAAGADVEIKASSVKVSKNGLKSFDFDASDSPDLFPALVALAANCEGVSRIGGLGRLSTKESNRAETLNSEFGKLGIRIELNEYEDCMTVEGCTTKSRIKKAVINSHNDHRIAMSAAVGALGLLDSEAEIVIEQADCVNKSYPGFWKDIDTIRCYK
ncbi:MAG: 3-phosphoshikimate 1-carboxyvinyltransferase [Prevotellaceae bacterium]|jgi:3-phosphoshikimate 1-carboxyvinyltransferase|nr:3-phosphoshikimate 1-carboxyvinyltransferase [Prevotellaceae bacterium]